MLLSKFVKSMKELISFCRNSKERIYEDIPKRHIHIRKKFKEFLDMEDVEFGFSLHLGKGKKRPLYFECIDMTEISENKVSLRLTLDKFKEGPLE